MTKFISKDKMDEPSYTGDVEADVITFTKRPRVYSFLSFLHFIDEMIPKTGGTIVITGPNFGDVERVISLLTLSVRFSKRQCVVMFDNSDRASLKSPHTRVVGCNSLADAEIVAQSCNPEIVVMLTSVSTEDVEALVLCSNNDRELLDALDALFPDSHQVIQPLDNRNKMDLTPQTNNGHGRKSKAGQVIGESHPELAQLKENLVKNKVLSLQMGAEDELSMLLAASKPSFDDLERFISLASFTSDDGKKSFAIKAHALRMLGKLNTGADVYPLPTGMGAKRVFLFSSPADVIAWLCNCHLLMSDAKVLPNVESLSVNAIVSSDPDTHVSFGFSSTNNLTGVVNGKVFHSPLVYDSGKLVAIAKSLNNTSRSKFNLTQTSNNRNSVITSPSEVNSDLIDAMRSRSWIEGVAGDVKRLFVTHLDTIEDHLEGYGHSGRVSENGEGFISSGASPHVGVRLTTSRPLGGEKGVVLFPMLTVKDNYGNGVHAWLLFSDSLVHRGLVDPKNHRVGAISFLGASPLDMVIIIADVLPDSVILSSYAPDSVVNAKEMTISRSVDEAFDNSSIEVTSVADKDFTVTDPTILLNGMGYALGANKESGISLVNVTRQSYKLSNIRGGAQDSAQFSVSRFTPVLSYKEGVNSRGVHVKLVKNNVKSVSLTSHDMLNMWPDGMKKIKL